MPDSYNVYLDESCHLENDSINVMMLGSVWCPKEKVRDIGIRIRDIQKQHGLSESYYLKYPNQRRKMEREYEAWSAEN